MKTTQFYTNINLWKNIFVSFIFLFSLSINSQNAVGDDLMATTNGALDTANTGSTSGGGCLPGGNQYETQTSPNTACGWTQGVAVNYAPNSTANGAPHSGDRMWKFLGGNGYTNGAPNAQLVAQEFEDVAPGTYTLKFYHKWTNGGQVAAGYAAGNAPKVSIKKSDGNGGWVNVFEDDLPQGNIGAGADWTEFSMTYEITELNDYKMQVYKAGGTSGDPHMFGALHLDTFSFTFDAAASTSSSVTFSVDMSLYNYTNPSPGLPSGDTVHLIGDMVGWDMDQAIALTQDSANPDIWSVTVDNMEDGDYLYKFVLNGNWGAQEWWPTTEVTDGGPISGCAVIDSNNNVNRSLTVAGSDVVVGTHHWNLCPGYDIGAAHDVTFSVNTQNITVADNGMFLGGGKFGGPDGFAMTDDDNDGVYEVTRPIYTFTTQQNEPRYIFINGGTADWSGKEDLTAQSCAVGQFNDRDLPLITESTTLLHCFGECEGNGTGECSSAGCTYTLVMMDSWGDGWDIGTLSVNGIDYTLAGGAEGTAEISMNYGDSFDVYVNNESEYADEVSWEIRDSEGNVVLSGDGTLGDAENPAALVCSAPTYNVTFSVDMSYFFTRTDIGVPEGLVPTINGTFTGWCGDCTPLTQSTTDPNVWEITIPLESGAYPWKFTIGSWIHQEGFNGTVPVDGCTAQNGDNVDRLLIVEDQDIVLPLYAWNSCTAEGLEPKAVTFTVNTNDLAAGAGVSENGIFLGGGVFGGPSAFPLSNVDGDNVWETTLYLTDNDALGKYIFLNGGGDWNTKENLEGQACADPANSNDRTLPAVIVDGDTLAHCFENCDGDGTGECASDPADGCSYSLFLQDSWGDGWSGNTIDVLVDGVSAGNYTVDDGVGVSYDITAPFGSVVTLQYNETGTYPDENTFSLLDAEGNVLTSGDMNSNGEAVNCLNPNVVALSVSVSGNSGPTTSVTFTFDMQNHSIGAMGEPHLHYVLNGGAVVMVYADMLNADGSLTLTDLPTGDHTIVFSLVDAGHNPLDPAVDVTVEFSTQEPAAAIVAPWSDDFEDGDVSDWTLYQAADASTGWALEAGEMTHGDDNVTNGVDNYLISPLLDCTELSSASVSFVEYQTFIIDWYDFHGVYYSEDYDGMNRETATWVELQNGSAPLNEPTVRVYEIPTTTTAIAWRYMGDYADNWFIDDVVVGETLSTNESEILDMVIYPNPVEGNFVTIQSPVDGSKDVQVYTVTGRKVIDTTINGNTLDVSSLNSGFYMINVTINGQSKISKLVVR